MLKLFRFEYFPLLFIIPLYLLFIFQPINLVTSDLGRHIKNGEIILSEISKMPSNASNWDILYTNYYSYTFPTEKFINHHWLSGVLFYAIYALFGFMGLQILNLLVVSLILIINFRTAKNFASNSVITFLMISLIPLVSARTEIRPEMISYLFSSIVLWILFNQNKNPRSLYVIPIIMLFWVNFHIYFILGYIFFFIFFISEQQIDKSILKRYMKILALMVICTLFNPFLLQGLAFPLVIFQKYGYEIIENKSIQYLYFYGIRIPEIYLVIIISALSLIASGLSIIKRKSSTKMLLLCLFFVFMGLYALRNINFLGFFIMIPLSFFIQKILISKPDYKLINFYSVLILILYFFVFSQNIFRPNKTKIILENSQHIADLPLKGNIFNNYDIGGYLIFNLFPKYKVFVDNRPEAYTVDFFKKTYIPIELYSEYWESSVKKYGIKTVILSKTDITDWGQSVLKRTKADQRWENIYEDERVVVLVSKDL